METKTQIEIERTWVATQPCITIRAMRTVSELPVFLREAYGKLFQYAGAPAEKALTFSRYHDWSSELIDVEAGITVKTALSGRDEIKPSRYGGHEALYVLHIGPYQEISPVYQAMEEYMKQHELQSGGAPYEVYLNSPDSVPTSELRTEVYWPIK